MAIAEGPCPVVQLEGIGRSFPGPPVVEVLHDVDLVIERGDYVSILGPSGSGKSTLLNVLGLLDRASAGRYLLDGVDTATLSEARRSFLRGSRIGFVFQSFHLLGHRSVEDNVELAMLYSGVRPGERRQRAVAALERVGMGHRLGFTPLTLSGGERQRVALARAVVNRPALLLADEPTGNLDEDTTGQILDLFAELHHDGLSLAVITHDGEVAAKARRQVHIRGGTLETVETGHRRVRPPAPDGVPDGPSGGGRDGRR